MPSMLTLQKKLGSHLQQAIATVTALPADTEGRDSSLRILQDNSKNIAAINMQSYSLLKAERADTARIFDDPVRKALADIGGTSFGNVPHNLKLMLSQQASSPNAATLTAIALFRKQLRSAYWDLRKLQDIRLRWAMSPWLPVLILLFALVYAGGFFIFSGAHIDHPTAIGGAGRLMEAAAADVADIKATVVMASDPIDAAQKFLHKLNELISQIPTIALTVGAAWAAVRKIWQSSSN